MYLCCISALQGRLESAINGTMIVKAINEDARNAKTRMSNKMDGLNTGKDFMFMFRHVVL